MKSLRTILLASAVALCICSCARTLSVSLTTTLPSTLNPNRTDAYAVSLTLPFSAFDDATVFNKHLAMVSLMQAIKTTNQRTITAFFESLGFDTITSKENYDDSSVMNTISFCFAHKTIGTDDIVAVALRGFGYGAEWGSNFMIGEHGDHEGFASAANSVYTALRTYITAHYSAAEKDGRLKLWITGYSRGGAVADVLSYLILSDAEKALSIAQKQVFVYTFNTPRALIKAHAIAYPNVYNCISAADLFTYIAPESYGLYRCGTDKVLFLSKKDDYTEQQRADGTIVCTTSIDAALRAFDNGIMLPPFLPQPAYATEQELITLFLHLLTESDPSAPDDTLPLTRERYTALIQPQIARHANDIQGMDDVLAIIMASAQESGSLTQAMPLLASLTSEENKNLTRILAMHQPEVIYVLLDNLALN